eukprot:8659303-Pyramimonas_sp.AAC.1
MQRSQEKGEEEKEKEAHVEEEGGEEGRKRGKQHEEEILKRAGALINTEAKTSETSNATRQFQRAHCFPRRSSQGRARIPGGSACPR